MICKKCGCLVPDDALTCDKCGTYQDGDSFRISGETGVKAIRQGRASAKTVTLPPRPGRMQTYGEEETYDPQQEYARRAYGGSYGSSYGRAMDSRPDTRRGVPVQTGSKPPLVRQHNSRRRGVRRSRTNWMLIGLLAVFVVMLAGVGYMVYMSQSDEGHRITARKLVLEATEEQFQLAVTRDPTLLEPQEELMREWTGIPSQTFWQIGEEYLDAGDLTTCITAFRLADVVDPDNYDGLLLMASSYELMGNQTEAEALYLRLLEISAFRAEAYTALIRIYQAQGRRPEAADMMKLAYENTDRESFRLQRKDYIPASPQVNLVAGRYEISAMEEDILITSPQGYDVYYTSDDNAVLPQDGILAQEGVIVPVEGTIKLRAVCVSGDLVSDPLSVSYTFFYPTPPAPKSNLAPNTYKSVQAVHLRPGKEEGLTKKEQAEMEANLTYYYSIDGSTPTEESPIYDGTAIQMPTGRVTLKAVCVNQYGKMSSTLEVGYKFDTKPYPLNMYGMNGTTVDVSADLFDGFELNKTSQEEFVSRFGSPKSVLDTTYLHLTEPARHLEYDWGYAVFALLNNKWQLVRVEMRSGFTGTPRGVGLGSSEAEVTGVFKDFGQVQAPNGTRGLYYDYPRVGQVLIAEDGTRYIQYTCQTLESKNWVLQYWLQNGHVKRIVHYYQP